MTVRWYTLPSTNEERLRLLAEIERDAAAVLGRVGLSVQERHRKAWHSRPMTQLRRCAQAWRETAERFASLPPKLALQSGPPSRQSYVSSNNIRMWVTSR